MRLLLKMVRTIHPVNLCGYNDDKWDREDKYKMELTDYGVVMTGKDQKGDLQQGFIPLANIKFVVLADGVDWDDGETDEIKVRARKAAKK